MDAIIWITGMSGIAFGTLVTHLEARRTIKNLKAAHKADLKFEKRFSYRNGFNEGYECAGRINDQVKLHVTKP